MSDDMETQLTNWLYTSTQPATYAAFAEERRAVPANLTHTPVPLPHVFLQSDKPNNSTGWYRTTLTPELVAGKAVFYLRLDGAGSVADAFVNGRHCGQHRGAYTAGLFDLTPGIQPGQGNTLDVRVTNVELETAGCLSQANLYTVYGGLYRPAWLLAKSALHIYPDAGSCGVFITTTRVSLESATLAVRVALRNVSAKPRDATVRVRCTDPAGETVATWQQTMTIPSGDIRSVTLTDNIRQPRLWGIRAPNLYLVTVDLIEDGRVVDTATEHAGLRSFEHRAGRFFLNGKEVLLRGVNKHQETEYNWGAITEQELREEWRLMSELGINTVRLAHYPHGRFEYRLADELGLLVWAENGNACQHIDPWTPDGDGVTREMVRQLCNHPSIVCWSAGNENVDCSAAARYAEAIREEDSSRPATFASQGWAPANCDFIAENVYSGWYEHGRNTLDYTNFHDPIIAENGAGAWIAHQRDYGALSTSWAVNRFEPEDHMLMFLEHRLQTIYRNHPDAHPMYLWWVFREFKNDKLKGRNSKGLITYAGLPKDAFYLWQCFARPEIPVLRILGRSWFLRQGNRDNGIKIYSTSREIRMVINGTERAVVRDGQYRHPNGFAVSHVFHASIPLDIGRNEVQVFDEHGHTDAAILYYYPPNHPSTATGGIIDLQSSNPDHPVYFIDRPIAEQEPFYYDFDSTGDNTWDQIPAELKGARWIATRRTGKPESRTGITFRADPAGSGITVSIIYTVTGTRTGPHTAIAMLFERTLSAFGFEPTPISGLWRDNALQLVKFAVVRKRIAPGETVSVPGEVLDYVILIS
jgi:beta-galactosidase